MLVTSVVVFKINAVAVKSKTLAKRRTSKVAATYHYSITLCTASRTGREEQSSTSRKMFSRPSVLSIAMEAWPHAKRAKKSDAAIINSFKAKATKETLARDTFKHRKIVIVIVNFWLQTCFIVRTFAQAIFKIWK